MYIGNKRHNVINGKKLNTNEQNAYKYKEYLEEMKINSNEIKIAKIANIKRKYLTKEKRKFEIKDNKNKINIIQNKINFLFHIIPKIEYNLLNLIIFFIKLSFLLCENQNENFLIKLSEVTLKINGTRNVTILSDSFYQRYNPCQIDINGSFKDNISNRYDFNDSEIITIKIKWNITIESTESMFDNCNRIIQIDLTYFNNSKVNNTSKMFRNCESLISLDLSNFDVSNAKDMNRMFNYCNY